MMPDVCEFYCVTAQCPNGLIDGEQIGSDVLSKIEHDQKSK